MTLERQGEAPGFEEAVRQIVEQEPGLTDREVARRAMRRGVGRGAAAETEAVLVGFLQEHYQRYGLERRRDSRGNERFYPGDALRAASLSARIAKRDRTLVELGLFTYDYRIVRDALRRGLAALWKRRSREGRP